jgi:flagellar biosynthesis component FlhA
LTLSPQKIREILDRLGRVAGSVDGPLVSVAGSGSRYFLRQVAEASFTNLTVLSHSEIPAGTKVVSLGVIA